MLKQLLSYDLKSGPICKELPIAFNYDTLVNAHYYKVHKQLSPDYVTELEKEDTYAVFFWKPSHPFSLNAMKKLGLIRYFSNPEYDGEFDKILLVFTKEDKLLKEIRSYKVDTLVFAILNIYSDSGKLMCQEEQIITNGEHKVVAARFATKQIPSFALGLYKKLKSNEIFIRTEKPYQDEKYSTKHPVSKATLYTIGNYYACIDNENNQFIYGDAVKGGPFVNITTSFYYTIKDRNPFGEVEITYDKYNRKITNIKVLKNYSDHSDEEVKSFYKMVEVDDRNWQVLFAVKDEKNGKRGIVIKDMNGYDIEYELYKYYEEYKPLSYPSE